MADSNNFKEIMSPKLKEKISARCSEKGLFDATCPMCGEKSFGLADGLFFHNTFKSVGNASPSGFGVPCAFLICKNCGFISEHSIGFLGLIEELKGD